MAFAAVGFFHRDLQIAATAGGVEIVNLKRTGGDGILINHIAVLTHHHQRVAVGGATDNRRVAFLAVWQHVAVGIELHAGIGHAVEHIRRRRALPYRQIAFHRHDIALSVGIDGGEAVLLFVTGGAAIPGRVVSHAPGTDIQTRAQVHILAAVVLLAWLARMALAGVGAVVEQTGGNAFIEIFRVDIATGYLAQRRLGNTQQQLLMADFKRGRCGRNHA